MQSDGKSFCEDVVFDSFNMAYRDRDRIKCKYIGIFMLKNLNIKSTLGICMHIKRNTAHNNKELIKLGLMLLMCQYDFSYNVIKN